MLLYYYIAALGTGTFVFVNWKGETNQRVFVVNWEAKKRVRKTLGFRNDCDGLVVGYEEGWTRITVSPGPLSRTLSRNLTDYLK